MGVAVVHPQECLKQPFSHMKYTKNPNKQRKSVSNRMRRSRSPLHNPTNRSPSPPLPISRNAVKKSLNSSVVAGNVRILKRGEELPQKRVDLDVENLDLESTRPIGPDSGKIPSQIGLSSRKSESAQFYAGPVTMASPFPSDLPVPSFTTKRSVSLFKITDATNDLIGILHSNSA